MTERERITAHIEACRANIETRQYQIAKVGRVIQEYEKELAALPPDKPDLSGWRPSGWGGLWFVGDSGIVEGMNAGFLGSDDPNAYQTRAEAERAAKRQRLHARLWQCHERLYGDSEWIPTWEETCWELLWKKGVGVVVNAGEHEVQAFGIPIFKTQQHAQWVIEQLQSEGLL